MSWSKHATRPDENEERDEYTSKRIPVNSPKSVVRVVVTKSHTATTMDTLRTLQPRLSREQLQRTTLLLTPKPQRSPRRPFRTQTRRAWSQSRDGGYLWTDSALITQMSWLTCSKCLNRWTVAKLHGQREVLMCRCNILLGCHVFNLCICNACRQVMTCTLHGLKTQDHPHSTQET